MAREGLTVVTGVNLPMLAEVLVNRAGGSLEELAAIAVKAGKDGIKPLEDILNPKP
jgi:PTS system mannose-specific IIA component